MEERLKQLVETPLSPSEVNQLSKKFGMNVKVVLYDQIINTKNIDDLFRKHPEGFVIFYPNFKEGNKISGHYVCLFKKGNTLFFYDSYSDEPDSQKNDVPQRNELSQSIQAIPYKVQPKWTMTVIPFLKGNPF